MERVQVMLAQPWWVVGRGDGMVLYCECTGVTGTSATRVAAGSSDTVAG